MRKSLLVFFACLCAAPFGLAQENTAKEIDFAARLLPRKPAAAHRSPRPTQLPGTQPTRAAFAAASLVSLLAPGGSTPAATAFAAAPAPKLFSKGGSAYNLGYEPKWQLGFGFSYMYFNGPSPLKGNLLGANASLSYFINEWFAVEGVATSVFSSKLILDRQHIKVGVYGGGIRMAYREERWQPWAHFAMGLAHEQPLTGWGGRNAFAFVVGGGTDYRMNPLLSLRIQADLVDTSFFGQNQRHYQGATGLVFHF